MTSAVIIDAVRTPIGRRNGVLSGWHPVDLAAEVLKGVVERNGVDPALIDDVILGCVTQVGNQALNIGRNAALAAGFPESVPGTTVDRQCGSSQQATHFGAQGVLAGAYDLVIAGGIEVMSTNAMGASVTPGSSPWGPTVLARYDMIPQGISAERIAQKWGFGRADVDAFAAESQQRAARATAEGRFEKEIVPTAGRKIDPEKGSVVELGEKVARDEGIREGTTVETLGNLKPAFDPEGVITAGNSSQISDGASAVLIASEEAAARLGLKPRARFHTFALAGDDPILMLTAIIPATEKVLARSGLSMADIDLFEVNEAFAPVVLAWAHEHKADMSKVNVNGGAIANGHPLGASGGKLTATLLHELERTGGRFGLQTMCEGGGMANAMIIERLD